MLRRYGEPLVVVHRRELIGLLRDALPADAVTTSTTVLGAEPGDDTTRATVRTDAGDLEADVVVAADGISGRQPGDAADEGRIRTSLQPSAIGGLG